MQYLSNYMIPQTILMIFQDVDVDVDVDVGSRGCTIEM